ncbi:MAG: hypothetical protein JXA60_06940 [Candidatus Coatesbacteria bacterium]|nr:hypothetical protein [Candidatus Coatesbacteria bacterium]
MNKVIFFILLTSACLFSATSIADIFGVKIGETLAIAQQKYPSLEESENKEFYFCAVDITDHEVPYRRVAVFLDKNKQYKIGAMYMYAKNADLTTTVKIYNLFREELGEPEEVTLTSAYWKRGETWIGVIFGDKWLAAIAFDPDFFKYTYGK